MCWQVPGWPGVSCSFSPLQNSTSLRIGAEAGSTHDFESGSGFLLRTLNGTQARFADRVAALALGVQEMETGSREKEVDGEGSVDADAVDLEFTGDWAMSIGLSR